MAHAPLPAEHASPGKSLAACVAPLAAVLALTMAYPSFAPPAFEIPGQPFADPSAPQKYLAVVGLQVLAGIALLAWFAPFYRRQFPFRVTGTGFAIGVVGGILWISICGLGWERMFFSALGIASLSEVRPGLNPFEAFPEQRWLAAFLAARFTLLVLVIPIVEELFIRGWLARWLTDPFWENVPLAQVSWRGLIGVIGYAVLTHPSEAIAAIAWFSLINWLMLRRGNLWDCILAHAITNLMLGLYVVLNARWELW